MKKIIAAGITLLFAGLLCVPAQSHRTKKPAKPVTDQPSPSAASTPQPQPTHTPGKRNGRPDAAGGEKTAKASEPNYFYEFDRPGFTFSKIHIEHDKAGSGKISFLRTGSDELFTDPITLTAVTVGIIDSALVKLDFLNSTETYQTARDFSTMGNITFTYKELGHERTVKYNWTENKDAKLLMDEYRRIGNEYTWKFEMSVARENQPLQTPGLMDQMDSYVTRDEISDPVHLVPYLTELSNDERLPLIARNHSSKLIKQIQKSAK